MDAPPPRIVVMGVSGSGKTTVGVRLANALHVPFLDGDDLHPAANVAKMRAGIPLTDADRAPWLDRVGEALAAAPRLVLACSALRRAYRDRIRALVPDVDFVELDVPAETTARRLRGRHHPFMPASLLPSQLAALQALGDDEAGVRIDAGGSLADTLARVLAAIDPAGSRTG